MRHQDRFTPAIPCAIADIKLVVCGLANLERALCRLEPTHIISLVDPMLPAGLIAMPELFGEHLVLRMEDHEDPGLSHAPTRAQARQIIEFAARVQPDNLLLVHCIGGRCRSTAAALGAALARFAVCDAAALKEVRTMLRVTAPRAIPNMLLTAHLDAELDLGGRLTAIAADIGQDGTRMLLEDAAR